MKKRKIHKIDLIFIKATIIMEALGILGDSIYWRGVTEGGFPVFTLLGVGASWFFWIILLMCSFFKSSEKQDKPKLVRWYMFYLVPVFFFIVGIIEFIVVDLILSIFS